MAYMLQRGFPNAPQPIAKLPADVPAVARGDWKYSCLLSGWVGHNLTPAQNEAHYQRRVDAA